MDAALRLLRLAAALAVLSAVAAPLAAQSKEDDGKEKDKPRRDSDSSLSSSDSSGERQTLAQRRKAAAAEREREAAKNSANNQQGGSAPSGGREGKAGRGGSGSSATRGGESGLGPVSMTFDRNAAILSHSAADPSEVGMSFVAKEGNEFWTAIRLDSFDPLNVDRFVFTLGYPKDILEPVGVDDAMIAGGLTEPPTVGVFPRAGLFSYEAALDRPMLVSPGPLLYIRWRPLRAAPLSQLPFAAIRGEYPGLFLGERDLLGSPQEADDGVTALDFSVLPRDPETLDELDDAAAFDFGFFEKYGGVRLSLEGPSQTPRAGEAFYVDLVLDNRSNSSLDAISARIEYDPDVLTILDADFDNGITLGVNIHDGPFAADFPFPYHIQNQVDASLGRITYRKGTDRPDQMRGRRGTIARIYALATAPTTATSMRFTFAEIDGYPSTAATFVGDDVLGDPAAKGDGVADLSFPILNAPAGAAVAAR